MEDKKQTEKLYTVCMAILAIISIVLVVMDTASLINLDSQPYSKIDNGILTIFAIDYFWNLLTSKRKLSYVKTHIFDLLSIIPFNAIFSFFRLTRIFRLARLTRLSKSLRFVRLVGLTGKLQKTVKNFFSTNGLIYLLITCAIFLVISSVLYSLAENVSLENAFWWAIATATTVGYGDISPQTPVGRFAAVILMFVGIGLIGAITSAITTFFTRNKENNNVDLILEKIDTLEQQNKELQEKIDNLTNQIHD